jgi:hypothetical protein
MDIKQLMQQMHNAQSEQEKNLIKEEIKSQFSSLSDSEKEEVRNSFMEGLNEKLEEADKLISKIDIALEISEISKYISLSSVASHYFGKSKEWLYQRIKGYNVNGKPAEFTPDEIRKLSTAFEDISRMAHETSLKFA